MELTVDRINNLLKIDDSYKAPAALMAILFDKNKREELFHQFLAVEKRLDYEWFQSYFENEHADRKNKKQDFTPLSVSKLLNKISGNSDSYFEATAGTGGITIQFWNNNPNAVYYLEELSDRAIPFLLFNLSIRNIEGIVVHGDSLTQEKKTIYKLKKSEKYSSIECLDDVIDFEAATILMNPPYSAKWSAATNFVNDPRFSSFEKLAPKSKADFAFLLHGYYRLKESGTMAIVLPHGVLFRGAAEGVIRKKLLEDGSIYAIIGMPANLFFGTSIPTTIIILKKRRADRDVLFIDASSEFIKGKNQNDLSEETIEKIVATFVARKNVEKYAYLAGFDEIQENDYNLNIPRYVDTFEEEEPIDIVALSKEMSEIDKQIEANNRELFTMISELTGDETIIEATKDMFKPQR